MLAHMPFVRTFIEIPIYEEMLISDKNFKDDICHAIFHFKLILIKYEIVWNPLIIKYMTKL